MWGVDWQPGGQPRCWCYPWNYLWKWLAKANARWRAAGSSLLKKTFPRKHNARWRWSSSILGYLARFTLPGLIPPSSQCRFSLISGWSWSYTCWSRCDLCPRGQVVVQVSGRYPLQQFAVCLSGIPLCSSCSVCLRCSPSTLSGHLVLQLWQKTPLTDLRSDIKCMWR